MSSDEMMLYGMLARRNADHRADVRDFRSYIGQLENQIRQLQSALAIQQCTAIGFEAQLNAFKAMYPQSPLMAASGKTYVDGEIKTRGRLIFEEAFDTKARSLGLRQPERIRQN